MGSKKKLKVFTRKRELISSMIQTRTPQTLRRHFNTVISKDMMKYFFSIATLVG